MSSCRHRGEDSLNFYSRLYWNLKMYLKIYGDKLNLYGTTRIYLRLPRGQAPKKVKTILDLKYYSGLITTTGV